MISALLESTGWPGCQRMLPADNYRKAVCPFPTKMTCLRSIMPLLPNVVSRGPRHHSYKYQSYRTSDSLSLVSAAIYFVDRGISFFKVPRNIFASFPEIPMLCYKAVAPSYPCQMHISFLVWMAHKSPKHQPKEVCGA
ncbi:uncharacterized protein PHALS_10080 [Plasmopara halstedii]|uniref:Uncharacterized protein n=1 Tax=Plasmopara halstedii TaxID=4781 RepID=A0A0P1AGW2_PLAHL|nr:uncharacterized protein PHALS_10080 [Plasmopara halstedii]CEG39847.1 hypothetical protein PHALS_10080 [Plasmopara halstedii]|eukprot:XP_024576216.1 hypothetical protein PHALS_10080 [Plasmopara halstedii]